jgi:hypothetical protein
MDEESLARERAFASERAMSMICGVVNDDTAGMFDQMRRIKRVVNAWVTYPGKLSDTETIEDLPGPR